MKAWPAVIAALIFLLPAALPAQNRRMEDIGFSDFWAKFKRALSANDKARIAAMTIWPSEASGPLNPARKPPGGAIRPAGDVRRDIIFRRAK